LRHPDWFFLKKFVGSEAECLSGAPVFSRARIRFSDPFSLLVSLFYFYFLFFIFAQDIKDLKPGFPE